MRRVLVDLARGRNAGKRGEGIQHVGLDAATEAAARLRDFAGLDEALDRLAALHARQSQVVVLRFFGGSTLEETADALGVSRDTVKRDWQFARLWLLRELAAETPFKGAHYPLP